MGTSADATALVLLAGSVSLAVAGQMLMKWGMSEGAVSQVGELIRAVFSVRVIAGLFCFVVSAMLWLPPAAMVTMLSRSPDALPWAPVQT